MTPTGRRTTSTPTETTSFVAAFARVYWMLFGNIGVGLLAVAIAKGPPSLTWMDAAYAAAAAALVAVRFLDVAILGGTTGDGNPATREDWRRYAVGVAAWSSIAWGCAHGVAWMLARG